MPTSAQPSARSDTFSDVHLRGRIAGATVIALPSGDEAVTFRVVVDRSTRQRGPTGRSVVDTIDCVAWTAHVRRRVLACADGNLVEVHGWLQRRFWRSGGAPASRTEVVATRIGRVPR